MERLFTQAQRDVSGATVVSPYSTEGARQVSGDGKVAYAEVNLADRSQEAFRDAGDEIQALGDRIHVDGLKIAYGGEMFTSGGAGGASEAIGVLLARSSSS